VQLGIAPGNEASVIPNEAVSIVKGDHGHGAFLASKTFDSPAPTAWHQPSDRP
jgi:hypothetical protein